MVKVVVGEGEEGVMVVDVGKVQSSQSAMWCCRRTVRLQGTLVFLSSRGG